MSFENVEVGNWFADIQGIVHKIAFKNADTLLLEHHISTDIAPAKTWIIKNEDMRQIVSIAHNGEVLLVDTLTTDGTRTIFAKQNGKVIKTTIDENGTQETKEEAIKNIELFSKFLQEDSQKEAVSIESIKQVLQNTKATKIPDEISIDTFLESLENFTNKENFIQHLQSKNDAQARLAFLNLVEPTFKQPDFHFKKIENGIQKDKRIKKFTNGKDFYYLLVTKDKDTTLLTGFKTNKINSIAKEFEGLDADIIQTFIQQGSKQDKQGLGYQSNVTDTAADSTPQNINNSLKNGESVENVAEGNVVSESSIAALEKERAELKDNINLLTTQEIELRESLNNATISRNQARKRIGTRNISIDDYIARFEKEHGAESIRKQYNEISDNIKAMRDKFAQLSRQIENDKDTLYRNTYTTLDEVYSAMHALKEKFDGKTQMPKDAQEEWNKLYQLSREMRREQELIERREEYATELLDYGYTKEQVANLTKLAETNPLARQIMENYESDTIGHGYSGYSMSNNAVNAYENGQKPLSKWTAQDAKDFGEVIGQKVSLKFLKEFLKEFGERGYHHTSKFYNETKFYSLSEALLSSRAREYLEKNLGAILTKAPQPTKQNIDNVGAQIEKQAAAQTQAAKQAAAQAQTTKAVALPDYAVDMERATELAARDKRQRLSDNLEALRTLARLENGAPLDKEAQEALGRYSGFGGTDYEKAHNELREILQSFPNSGDVPFSELLFNQIITTTKNAYYTPHEVIGAIYAQLGFVKGRVLEPSLGIGNFFAAMPEGLRNKTQRVGVELDSVSARIAQYLHPNARIENGSFEEFSDNLGFDLVIGNPPYEGKMNGMPIVGAFLQKSLALAKDNGIVVQVVSNAFLDNPASRAARMAIAKDAAFLGAVRLPSDTFSGTSVATDIVVFQKRKGGGDSAFVGAAQHNDGTQSLPLNDYYHAHPEHILGTLRAIDTNYNGKRWSVDGDSSIVRLPDVLESIFKNRIGASDAIVDNVEQQDIRRYTGNARNGSLVQIGENVYTISAGDRFSRSLEEISWLERINKGSRGKSFDALSEAGKNKRLSDSKKAQEMAKDYIALRDNLEKLRKAEMENDVRMEDYREQLKECYEYFKTKHCNGGRIAENRILNAAFVDEPSYWLVRDLDSQGEHKILRQRVGIPIEIPTRAENLQDAIAISKTYAGKIDAEFVETLVDDKAKVRQAFDEGELFDVKGEILTKEEYLSGDLGAKIDALEAKAELSPTEQNALRLLKESLPKPLGIKEIYYSPSSRFVPNEAF